ncbi:MAG: hypothetical protein PVF85_02400, partial [Anaerolineales bacterium]
LALLVATLDLLVLTGQPFALYPLAILSALGVLVLLTMAYALIALQILKREAVTEKLSGLILPLAMGFGLALLQIGGIDLVRYILTGTWSGFNL